MLYHEKRTPGHPQYVKNPAAYFSNTNTKLKKEPTLDISETQKFRNGGQSFKKDTSLYAQQEKNLAKTVDERAILQNTAEVEEDHNSKVTSLNKQT